MVISEKLIKNDFYIDRYSKLLYELWIDFKNIEFYIQAFIHRSIINEKPDIWEHNERLEFLWDAVLELVITEKLFADFPSKPEWELTDIRSALVRWRNLAVVSRKLWFQDYLFLGKWENLGWWRENDYLLANVCESLIWAIYLDLWLEASRDFILTQVYTTLETILENRLFKDYKSMIQEFAQAKYWKTPAYEVLSDIWPDHDKVFTCWVYVGENLVWTWEWSSKKKAQEQAAENAYLNQESWNI